jgi:DNA-binding transcriptional MerR regulator/predicted transcriptional regulator YdeE
MFSIGEFARHGRISVRMLRHYDAIGVLVPATVDPVSGYRFYQAGQLSRLNRIIALKDLGFSLRQVQQILDEQVSGAELRGMLKLRRAELSAQIEADTARLSRIEARLQAIEREDVAPGDGVVVKPLPAIRVAELTGTAAGYEPAAITPVIQPLYGDLFCRLARAGFTPTGPAVAYYEDFPHGEGAITVHAAVHLAAGRDDDHDFSVVDLPEVRCAATVIHHGSMDDVLPTVQALARWIDASGYRSAGYPRELTIEHSDDRDKWVTELQEPVAPAAGSVRDESRLDSSS